MANIAPHQAPAPEALGVQHTYQRSSVLARAVERGALALAVVALFALGWRHMDLLGDSFWSIATGRWILQHARLPETDPFSFTASGPWIVHMPLSQIAFAWLEARVGPLGLELFGSLLLSAALLCLWLPHARGSLARFLCWPLVVLHVALQADDLCVRGQLFGDLCVAWLLLCLFRLRDGGRVHALWPAAMGSVWINLHASAFLAVTLPLAFGLAVRLGSRPTLAAAAPPSVAGELRALRPWLAFTGLAALGMLINPYGFGLIRDLIGLMRASSTAAIDLFGPPDFASPATIAVVVVVVATLALAASRRLPPAGLPEAIILGALLVAACVARRHQPLALAFAIVIVARAASRRLPAFERPRIRRAAAIATAAAATVIALHGLSAVKDPWRDVPLEEARLIEEAGLPDNVANAYHWGGFLDYVWAPRRKVFIDGRNQLFEGRVFDDAGRLERLEQWPEVLAHHRINTVLWERGSGLDRALSQSPDWSLVRRGRIAVVYVRRQPLSSMTAASPSGG